MDCIISAGGIPQEDEPLFAESQGKPKALIDIAGKPMVQWVLDALTGAAKVDRVILVGLSEADGLVSSKLVAFLPDQGSMLANVIAGVDRLMVTAPETPQVLMCSADIPLIRPHMVDGLIEQCADRSFDLHYGAVRRELMEGRFPGSRRSYVHLSDGDMAGADIFVMNPQVAYRNREFWESLIGNRKNALKQARRFGFGTLIKLLLRRLSLTEAESRVQRAMGFSGRAVLVEHAELGMDVDKPFQLEICRRELGA